MQNVNSLSLCAIVLLSVGSSFAAEPASLDPALPYSAERVNSVTYDVDYTVVVTAPYKTKLLRVWVPVPPSNVGQEVLGQTWSTFPDDLAPQIAAESKFGNRFAYFEFQSPQGGQTIRQRLQIKVWELRWKLDLSQVADVTEWPATFQPYRRSESQAIVVDARHREFLAKLLPERRGSPADLNAVMGFALGKFKYDHGAASLAADSLHALQSGGGHCSDYHGFCAAVGRALGYPTRITYGINPFPKASPSHCKLEAFFPPVGWVSFDVSETQKLIGAIRGDDQLAETEKQRLVAAAVARLQSGFRDNTWYLQTVGSDYDLAPAASRRVPIVRTIYAEADGVPLVDPDPSDASEKMFAWMTSFKATPDRPTPYPFAGAKSLENR